MFEINDEIRKSKQKIKDLKKLKKLMKKNDRIRKIIYKPSPYFVFLELLHELVDIVKKEKYNDDK